MDVQILVCFEHIQTKRASYGTIPTHEKTLLYLSSIKIKLQASWHHKDVILLGSKRKKAYAYYSYIE